MKMSEKKRFIAIFLALILTLCAVGCTPSNPAPSEGGGSVTSQAPSESGLSAPTTYSYTPPEEMIGDAGSFEGLTIGFSQRSVAGSSWYENLIRIAKAEAEHLGINLIVSDANGDLVQQTADIEDMIAQGVDAIIVNPVDPAGIIASTEKLHSAGIPIINVNSQMDASAAPTSFVGNDTYSFGYSSGYALAQAFDAKHGNPEEIKAAMLMGFPKELYSLYESNGMIAGFHAYFLDKYNRVNLNIVASRFGEWSTDTALKEMDDVLAANPDIDIIFSLDGIMLMGAVSALKSAGLEDKVMICTAGGRKEELQMIIDGGGNSGLVASATCDPRQEGKWSVLIAAYAAKGVNVPGTLYIQSDGITIDNAKDLYDPNSAY